MDEDSRESFEESDNEIDEEQSNDEETEQERVSWIPILLPLSIIYKINHFILMCDWTDL